MRRIRLADLDGRCAAPTPYAPAMPRTSSPLSGSEKDRNPSVRRMPSTKAIVRSGGAARQDGRTIADRPRRWWLGRRISVLVELCRSTVTRIHRLDVHGDRRHIRSMSMAARLAAGPDSVGRTKIRPTSRSLARRVRSEQPSGNARCIRGTPGAAAIPSCLQSPRAASYEQVYSQPGWFRR